MSILNKFKKSVNKTSVSTQLPGGIHDFISLVEYVKERESFGGYKRYLILKFKKSDDEGNTLGEFTHSFMEIDASSDYVGMKVENLLVQTQSLAEALFGDEWVEKYDPLVDLLDDVADAKRNALNSKLKKREFVKSVESAVKDQVMIFLDEFSELNNEKKFRLKLVYNDKGYINIPNYKFIEPMDTKSTMILSDKDKSLIKKFKK